MTIETKFNIGDTAYRLYNSKIRKVTVTDIHITINENQTLVLYDLQTTTDAYESNLYTTKEEAAQAWLASNDLKIALI